MNRLANTLSIVTTNLYGFSLANHRGFPKLSCYTVNCYHLRTWQLARRIGITYFTGHRSKVKLDKNINLRRFINNKLIGEVIPQAQKSITKNCFLFCEFCCLALNLLNHDDIFIVILFDSSDVCGLLKQQQSRDECHIVRLLKVLKIMK